jgi:molybdopterin synthase sulfur carrier subunit
MSIKIKTFGKLAELVGDHDFKIVARDTDTLKAELFSQFPLLVEMKFFIAINNRMVKTNTSFGDDAVIALLPPFSGG